MLTGGLIVYLFKNSFEENQSSKALHVLRQEVVKLVRENTKRTTKFFPRLKSFLTFAKTARGVFLPVSNARMEGFTPM